MATTSFTVTFTSDDPLPKADKEYLKRELSEAVQDMFKDGHVTPEDSDSNVTDFMITVPPLPSSILHSL